MGEKDDVALSLEVEISGLVPISCSWSLLCPGKGCKLKVWFLEYPDGAQDPVIRFAVGLGFLQGFVAKGFSPLRRNNDTL